MWKKCFKCKVQFCIHTALMIAIFELSLYCRVFMKNYVFIFDFVSCILQYLILKFVYCCISIVTIKKWHLITRKLHFILNTLYSPLSPNHTSLRGTGHMKFFSLWERVDVTSKAFYCCGILDKYTLLYTRWCFSDAVVEYWSLGEASTD